MHPNDVVCDLITRREGLLSAVGHDLRLRVPAPRLTIDASTRTLTVTLDAASIVLGAALDGERDLPGALSPHDEEKILRALRDEVLDVRRYPTIVARLGVSVEGARVVLDGTLTLHGVTEPLRSEAIRDRDQWRSVFVVDHTRFGIKPFRAFLGALQVRPSVTVRVAVATHAVASLLTA